MKKERKKKEAIPSPRCNSQGRALLGKMSYSPSCSKRCRSRVAIRRLGGRHTDFDKTEGPGRGLDARQEIKKTYFQCASSEWDVRNAPLATAARSLDTTLPITSASSGRKKLTITTVS